MIEINHHTMSWRQFLRTQELTIPLNVTNYNTLLILGCERAKK